MLVVNACNGPTIEQLFIDNVEIRAVSLQEHVLGGSGIGTVKVNRNLNVIKHTQSVVDRVIAHGLDGHFAKLHTTHDAFNTDYSHRLTTKVTT